MQLCYDKVSAHSILRKKLYIPKNTSFQFLAQIGSRLFQNCNFRYAGLCNWMLWQVSAYSNLGKKLAYIPKKHKFSVLAQIGSRLLGIVFLVCWAFCNEGCYDRVSSILSWGKSYISRKHKFSVLAQIGYSPVGNCILVCWAMQLRMLGRRGTIHSIPGKKLAYIPKHKFSVFWHKGSRLFGSACFVMLGCIWR
jgi:hypothetical protein